MTAGNVAPGALAAVMATTDAPLLVVDDRGTVLAANDAFEAQFGFVPLDLDALDSLSAGEPGHEVRLSSLLRRDAPVSGITRLRTATGQVVRASYGVTRLSAGPQDGSVILALQALAQRVVSPDNNVAALAEGAPCAVWVAAADGTLLFANGPLPDGLGEADPSHPFLTRVHPDDDVRCRSRWEAARRTQAPYEASARHRRADGSYARFLTRAAPLATDDGELVGWFGATTALDEAGAVREGRPSAPDLEPADQRLATASHEIRSPLGVLLGTVQLTRRRAASRQLTGDELQEALESIEQQAGRALQLVEEFLDQSRIDMGRLRLQRSSLDVASLVKQVLQRVAAASASHRFTLRTGGPAVADVDARRIEQVVLNLVDNAMKFSAPGSSIETSVSTAGSGPGAVVEIAVRDHGRGVPAGEEARILERFHQVAEADAARGLGMGLALSKEIVELHGGTLTVERPEGAGTRFVIRLPAGVA